jgi:hypothetical protein
MPCAVISVTDPGVLLRTAIGTVSPPRTGKVSGACATTATFPESPAPKVGEALPAKYKDLVGRGDGTPELDGDADGETAMDPAVDDAVLEPAPHAVDIPARMAIATNTRTLAAVDTESMRPR